MRNYTAHRAEIPELRKAAGMDKGARLMLKNGTCLGDINDYRCFKDRRPEPQDFALFVRWEIDYFSTFEPQHYPNGECYLSVEDDYY